MNRLSQSTSPYLLQHATNPVHWQPWDEKALEQAKSENKLILVSIGYSACHWCHVMEHESFENEEVANIMNQYFVSIKIDREERPDLDHVYMGAVQLMTQRGGWPLNVICMPDARPVWGGTYFPRESWMSALKQLAEIFEKNPEKVREYADQLHEGLVQSEMIHIPFDKHLEDVPLTHLMAKLAEKNDLENGGEKRAPKFPMPGLYSSYLKYAVLKNDEKWLQHIHKTLEAMALRGLNDLVHGGFFRYATDEYWHIPHFEKMLYDNAQLLSLYSKAYGHFKNPLFKKTVEQIFEFLENEMRDSTGAYFAALDADSEGVEGKYYTLSAEELASLEPEESIKDTFNLYDSFVWEHVYHLHQTESDAVLAKKWNLNIEVFHDKKNAFLERVKSLRDSKIRPGLDDKVIIAWNALAVSGLVDAHCYLGSDRYLQKAEDIAQLLLIELQKDQPGHYFKGGISVGKVQLEDYVHTADALHKLFQITNKDLYYQGFTDILQRTQKHFGQSKSVYFPLAQNHENELFYAGIDLDDNVIPATNSVIAKLLYAQGLLTANHAAKEQALLMLQGVLEKIEYYLPAYYLWTELYMDVTQNHKELVISCFEKNNSLYLQKFYSDYRPQVSLYLLNKESDLSLFASRFGAEELLYLCEGTECKLPVKEFEALEF